MRGRLALLTGFAAGYVLGTRAGTERYEQIRDQFNKLMGTEHPEYLKRFAAVTAKKTKKDKDKSLDATSRPSPA